MIKYLWVFFISMLPIVELRLAIPIAEKMGLDVFWYYPVAVLGNMLPVPLIYLFARKVLEWGKDKRLIGKIFSILLTKGEKAGKKLELSVGRSGVFFALLLFVGVPLPGTGAWTGALAASFLGLDFKTSISAVMLGVLLAGVIMSCSSLFVARFGIPGLIILLGIVVLVVGLTIILSKKKKQ